MRIYLSALLVIAVLLIAHILGNDYGLYLSIWPYDIFMHMLGGFGLGLFVAALIESHLPGMTGKRGKIILAVFIIGIIWEIFEAYFNIAGYTFGTKLYWLDTIKDVIDDIIGATTAAFVVFKSIRSIRINS